LLRKQKRYHKNKQKRVYRVQMQTIASLYSLKMFHFAIPNIVLLLKVSQSTLKISWLCAVKALANTGQRTATHSCYFNLISLDYCQINIKN